MNRIVFAVLAFLALCLCTTHAAITFEQNGQTHTVPTPQLWYEGYWKDVRLAKSDLCDSGVRQARKSTFLAVVPQSSASRPARFKLFLEASSKLRSPPFSAKRPH